MDRKVVSGGPESYASDENGSRRKSAGMRFQLPGVPLAWRRTTSSYAESEHSTTRQPVSYRRGINETTNLHSTYMRELLKIIEDPIQCGYLLAFCDSEFSVENLKFVMEVDKFRDFLLTDSKAWRSTWVELDPTVFVKSSKNSTVRSFAKEDTIPEAVQEVVQDVAQAISLIQPQTQRSNDNSSPDASPSWPSRVVQRKQAEAIMNSIFDEYLNEDSPQEICNPPYVLRRTKRRMDLLHLYGPDVFAEALYEPFRTLRKDTLPRFLKSQLYKEMETQLAAAAPLGAGKAKSLSVPPPTGSILRKDNLSSFPDSRRFELAEILEDAFLYDQFHGYLQQIVSPENLLCVRMIAVFGTLLAKGNLSAARSHAWNIYRSFVAEGAAHEVALTVRQRKDVMISLARPTADMFAVLLSATTASLMANFNAYKFTEEYSTLSRRLKDSKQNKHLVVRMMPFLGNIISEKSSAVSNQSENTSIKLKPPS